MRQVRPPYDCGNVCGLLVERRANYGELSTVDPPRCHFPHAFHRVSTFHSHGYQQGSGFPQPFDYLLHVSVECRVGLPVLKDFLARMDYGGVVSPAKLLPYSGQ